MGVLLLTVVALTGCTLFQKEIIEVDTGDITTGVDVSVEDELEFDVETEDASLADTGAELSGDVDVVSGDIAVDVEVEAEVDAEVNLDDPDLETTVQELIDERKGDLWSDDNLTEEDIQLMEDILDELIKSVE